MRERAWDLLNETKENFKQNESNFLAQLIIQGDLTEDEIIDSICDQQLFVFPKITTFPGNIF